MRHRKKRNIINMGPKHSGGIRRVVADAWNSLRQTAFGPAGNAASSNWVFTPVPHLQPTTLDNLYDGNWLAARIIDLLPEVAFKDGMGFTPEADARYKEVGVTNRLPEGVWLRACNMARLHGGAVILAAHEKGAGDLTVPLDTDPGPVKWLDVFARSELDILTRTNADVLEPEPDSPEIFRVKKGKRAQLKFHESRAIVLQGVTPSPTCSETHLDNFWGKSVLQALYEALLRVGQRNAAVDRLMTRSSTQALELEGLLNAIAGEGKVDLDNRLDVLADGIEKTDLILLEKGEKYTPHNVSMSGLDGPVTISKEDVAGAAGYPVTVLFGTSPGGLNATGESDMRNFYAKVEAYRTVLNPQLERLAKWLTVSDTQPIRFEPVHTPTTEERNTNLTTKVAAYSQLDELVGLDPDSIMTSLRAEKLIPPTLRKDTTDDGTTTQDPAVPEG